MIPIPTHQINSSLCNCTGVTCAAGNDGSGGVCSCEKAAAIDQGEWERNQCHEGNCYAGQDYDSCIGKENGYDLGDDTWCFHNKRWTHCPTSGQTGTLN